MLTNGDGKGSNDRIQPRHDKIQQEMKRTAREIGDLLKAGMPPGVGFGLVLATMDDTDVKQRSWMQWISSCDRKDMIKLLEELLESLKSDKAGQDPQN